MAFTSSFVFNIYLLHQLNLVFFYEDIKLLLIHVFYQIEIFDNSIHAIAFFIVYWNETLETLELGDFYCMEFTGQYPLYQAD